MVGVYRGVLDPLNGRWTSTDSVSILNISLGIAMDDNHG